MSDHVIHPVLLCGGSGSRLWPLSRKSYPKQFVELTGTESLFQASALRLSGARYAAPVVVTGADYRFIVTEQLNAVDLPASAILIEPEGRNTAPAVLAAALHLRDVDPNALMLISPSDHVIPDAAAFQAAVETAVPAALEGRLVTFGISPTRPETGYGYLELDRNVRGDVIPLLRFVEKPDAARAQEMLDQGGFLWNAGIFLFSVQAIIAAFETHAPEMINAVDAALKAGHKDLSFLKIDAERWSDAEDTSIDYAVMEKADNLAVVPLSLAWSDLGDWDSVWREGEQADDGVILHGDAEALNCTGSLLRAEADGQKLVGLGLENIIAIAMPDAVLVADRSRAQDVKKVVTTLKAKQAPQAETLPRDYRPWGWFENLATGGRWQVKRIVVNPGGRLSLQSHEHRSEHWIVVQGTAKVTIGTDVRMIGENQSVYVPKGAIHRLENEGDDVMILIEVQTGSYFGEDDITRFEDAYARD